MTPASPAIRQLISADVRAQLDHARGLHASLSAGKGDTAEHDTVVAKLESALADLEQKALDAERTFVEDPMSLRKQADALRRELNHVRYTK